jgi:hypothetical protein
MLSAEERWGIMGAYGATVWPAQAIFFLVAVALVLFLFVKPRKPSNILMKLYLVFSFGWSGIVFFIILGRGLAGDYGNYFFGSLFTVVAILFAVDLVRHSMEFLLPGANPQRWLTIILTAIVFCYPLFSLAFGQPFPRMIMPGTLPCPTTALPRVDKIIYFILLFWAIPFSPLTQIPKYGVYEDGGHHACCRDLQPPHAGGELEDEEHGQPEDGANLVNSTAHPHRYRFC